ncbi:hypothetical protein [Sorangium sp. So ce861]|uniref:hypothetical protein n=1 Tax=Sorangium sp. So ce861 TaxID=3133323 RepID=UPI003F60937D
MNTFRNYSIKIAASMYTALLGGSILIGASNAVAEEPEEQPYVSETTVPHDPENMSCYVRECGINIPSSCEISCPNQAICTCDCTVDLPLIGCVKEVPRCVCV